MLGKSGPGHFSGGHEELRLSPRRGSPPQAIIYWRCNRLSRRGADQALPWRQWAKLRLKRGKPAQDTLPDLFEFAEVGLGAGNVSFEIATHDVEDLGQDRVTQGVKNLVPLFSAYDDVLGA